MDCHIRTRSIIPTHPFCGFEFTDELRAQPDCHEIPVVVITAKDLTDEDRDRLNGGVERIIEKSDRDEMLRQLSREVAKCVKR